MRKNLLATVFCLFMITVQAQYITPGTGINWNLGDLVENSGGVITLEINGQYSINNNLTLSNADTLTIVTPEEINVLDEVLIIIKGVLLIDPPEPGIVFFKAMNNYSTGFRFEDNDGSSLSRTYFRKAGGIDLVNADIQFFNCDFTEFNQENSTGTIDLFQSSPLISACSFSDNFGPAVMSGANGSSSPQIFNCEIISNVMSNANMPQINLGTSGADSIRIVGCEIIGNPANIMAGGIAITTLAGGSIKARIEGNIIKNNRYGITAYGYNIGSVIGNNEIRDNNTQNLPMQGGSGINYWGNASNQSIVTGNIISGNLWGVTIQSAAQPNLGQLEGEIYNPGMNQFYNNGNSGQLYDLYNNTPNAIMAENNYWGTMDPDSVEMRIFHQPDDPTLGWVDYQPLFFPPVGIVDNAGSVKSQLVEIIYPNPANLSFYLKLKNRPENPEEKPLIELYNLNGEKLSACEIHETEKPVKMWIPEGVSGVVLIKIKYIGKEETLKIVVR